MDEMDLSQFREVFISEAKEHLVSMNTALVELEKKPSNTEVLNTIFRLAHTLKGMSATMGYDKITNLTHQMEDVLDKLRKGETQAKGNVVDVIFECFDTLEKLIAEIESNKESIVDIDPIMKKLIGLIEDGEDTPGNSGEEKKSPINQMQDNKPDVFVEHEQESEELIVGSKNKQSIRINISHLDNVMNLVGEMVISKSQLDQLATKYKLEEINEALRNLSRVAVDLQEAVLKTRMVPLSQIFDRYPRMVRDLALKLGKEVDFEITGADIEIDRILLDEINEPLVHLLRNALDHGVEFGDVREKAGKPRKGTIKLIARRERGYITIQSVDDGRGLDLELIRQTAIKRDVISRESSGSLTDEAIYSLICDPKFSTAEKVTSISGRGVGMDIVKSKIESFNGTLKISSAKGVGSTFTINLPLSIAIITALMVQAENEMYAVPLNNITEVVPFDQKDIQSIDRREVIILRDEVLPIVWLSRKMGMKNTNDLEKKNLFILRLEVGNKAVGLVIDKFLGRNEIVIKTLSGVTRKSRGFSGATILGDGSVVLILDVNSIVALS